MNTTITFEEMKAMCHAACRERQACKEGFAQMLRAETPTQLLRAWTDNWADVWKDRYADMLAGKVEGLYAQYRREFHDVGLWVNECCGRGRVLITGVAIGGQIAEHPNGGENAAGMHGPTNDGPSSDDGPNGGQSAEHPNGDESPTSNERPMMVVRVGGTARAFVVGGAEVHAYGNSIVYNHAAQDAVVVLHDYAHGFIEAGRVVARDQSHVQVSGDGVLAECYGRSEVFMTAGTLTDHGHHSIEAYGERAVVKGCVTRRITLADGARMMNEIINKE